MKSFKEYLMEEAKTGNYIAIHAEDLNSIFHNEGMEQPISGESPPNGHYHCTIIYSEHTQVSPKRIADQLRSTLFSKSMVADVVGFECFDSKEADKTTLVARLECAELDKIHDYLKSFNLIHSYADFKPHVTIRYNMDIDEANFFRDMLNRSDGVRKVVLFDIYSETINKNYV